MENKQILKILMEAITFIKENNYFLYQFGKAFDTQIKGFNKKSTDDKSRDFDEELNVIQLRDMCLVLNENAIKLEAAINEATATLTDLMIEEEMKKEMDKKIIEFDKDTHTATPQSSFYCDDTKIEEQRLDGKEESGIERLLKAIRG